MIAYLVQITDELENIFSKLEKNIPKPKKTTYANHFTYRYNEHNVQVVTIQKISRIITGLRASIILLQNGYLQELAVLQRVLDDIGEELDFLVLGKLMGTWGHFHDKYISSFFTEVFNNPLKPMSALEVKKPIVTRKQVRKCINESIDVMKKQGASIDNNRSDAARVISSVFDGFVHASSTQILDMYGGDPPHYHLRGMSNTPKQTEYTHSLLNQFYRGTLNFNLVCLLFEELDLGQEANSISQRLSLIISQRT